MPHHTNRTDLHEHTDLIKPLYYVGEVSPPTNAKSGKSTPDAIHCAIEDQPKRLLFELRTNQACMPWFMSVSFRNKVVRSVYSGQVISWDYQYLTRHGDSFRSSLLFA